MSIILDRRIVSDDWTFVPAGDGTATGDTIVLPDAAKLIVPLKVWQAQRDVLLNRAALGEPLGVWLDSHEDPQALAEDVDRFALVAVNFPRFTDGRGYSIAALLRTRYGFTGELRAIGDVLRDQIFYMKRAGFNAFAVRSDKSIEEALAAFDDFSETYQGAADQPLPLFRRRGPADGSNPVRAPVLLKDGGARAE